MTDTPLSGRIALVTGATRSIGIGVAIVRRLAADGADVAFTHFLSYDKAMYDAPTGGPNDLLAEIETFGRRGLSLPVDLSAPGFAGPLLDKVTSELGPVDILVNNAA